MRIWGKPLAWFGLLVAVVVVAIVAVQAGPRPVLDGAVTGGPGSAAFPGGGLAAGASHAAPMSSIAAPSKGPAGSGSIPDPSLVASAAPPATGGSGPSVAPTLAPTSTPTRVPAPGPTLAPTPMATPAPSLPPATPGPIPPLSACPIFPSTNVWNRLVDGLPVASNSAAMITAIGIDASLHPDFSDAGGYGIPFNVVGASTPRSTVSFQYDDESDHVGYPIPASPKIEGGSDRHILMIDTNDCTLYELFAASKAGGAWSAGSGAVWDLGSNELRPDGWTSADAAGLPIFPGLVRWSEVATGSIHHAIRFTAPSTCGDDWLYPARHEAGSGSCSVKPPMGLRVRLKASVDISGFGPQARVILTALQQYGMLLADNGSPWYITGAPDGHWNDDELHDLGQLTGSDFEVVDTAGFVNE